MNEREWQRDQFIRKYQGKGIPKKALSKIHTIAWKSGKGVIDQVDSLGFAMVSGYTLCLANNRKRRR